MSNYDRNYSFGAQVGQKAAAEIDQGLRAYMIGVYNYMTLGLGVTGLVALGTNMMAVTRSAAGHLALTPFGQAIYMSPLRWVIVLAPRSFLPRSRSLIASSMASKSKPRWAANF